MQFRLMTLMLLMSAISVGCALLFAAPRMVSLPVLIGMLWISPSFWIAGVVYARGNRQAFFVGGLVAGLVPFLVACSYSSSIAIQWVSTISNEADGRINSPLFGDDSNAFLVGIALLAPLVFSLFGGGVAVLTRIISLPYKQRPAAQNSPTRPRPHALDENPIVEYTIRSMRRADMSAEDEPLSPPHVGESLE